MRLAILWHFHQPIYKKPGSWDYVLPWVDYHAKNYDQMGRLVEECGWPCTFNFVPCLLEQMEDYETGRAVDPFRDALAKDPAKLDANDAALLKIFLPKTRERDPAALQALAWMEMFSPLDEVPTEMEARLKKRAEIHRGILPRYQRLRDEGRLELTASAYYHPLLPLVFDLAAAGPERPPGVSYRYPADGLYQIQRGREYFTRVFGLAPRGLWPSEGGISPAVAQAAVVAGYDFAVTDENLLWKSLGRPRDFKSLCRPYNCEGLSVFFRDQELSDLIGFEYMRWNAKEAAADMLRRIQSRRREAGDDAVLVLALDGENPWGAYPDNGLAFLREFYGALGRDKSLFPALLDDERRRFDRMPSLDLVPGTWLGSCCKWAGSEAKNAGWAELSRARADCGPVDSLYVAEGSDWFWWFGEEPHPAFGELFHLYIADGYRQAGVKKP